METYHYSNIDEELKELELKQNKNMLFCDSCYHFTYCNDKTKDNIHYCSRCGQEMKSIKEKEKEYLINFYNKLNLNYDDLTEAEKQNISYLEEKYSITLAQ